MSTPSKKLKVTCQLGAVYAPEGGYVAGQYARTHVQPDPTNAIPQTYYYSDASRSVSDNLVSVPQGVGGLLPNVNNALGSPMCTFVYGGIAPDEPHQQYNLIKGPSQSIYNPNFSSTAAVGTFIGNADPSPVSIFGNTGTPNAFGFSLNPLIPSFILPAAGTGQSDANAVMRSAPVLPTYNIWQIVNLDETTVSYQKGYGIIYNNTNTPTIQQAGKDSNGAYIEVRAAQSHIEIYRQFSIAQDTAYDPMAKLYYPASKATSAFSRPILARGGENCGFQLHFNFSSISRSNNASSQDAGGILIKWGASSLPDVAGPVSNSITNFNLILSTSQIPKLLFYHPKYGWQNFPIKGAPMSAGHYSVYVHYAGPYMFIGFDTETQSWNCFVPIPDRADYSVQYFAHTPAESNISIEFSNIVCSFQYGPMAFNNYHPENLPNITNFNPNSGNDYGYIKSLFSVAKTKSAFYSEDALNNELQSHRILAIPQIINNKLTTVPTYHGDWRRSGGELVYKSDASNANQQNTYDPQDINILGKIIYQTTIEGPQWIHLHNAVPNNTNFNPDKLIQKLDWGDVSEFFTEASISYNLTGDNHTILEGKAEITLVDLANNDRGRNVLTLIGENKLSLTLSSGYDDTTNDFFEGIIEIADTEYGVGHSITKLTCTDISTSILETTHFRDTFNFTSMRYGDIIKTCVDMSGLGEWYYVDKTDKILFGDGTPQNPGSLNLRLGQFAQDTSLANNVAQADPTKFILQTIKGAIKPIIDINVLPVFYWDNTQQKITLCRRQRSDLLDTLTFAGTPDDTGTIELPDSFHGIVLDKYRIKTYNKQLHSGVIVYGQSATAQVISAEYRNPYAYSANGLKDLQDAINTLDTKGQIGYVGYRKILLDEENASVLPDQSSLNRYALQIYNNFITNTYEIIQFNCFVETPLHHMGQFKIGTFGTETDAYLYKTVTYNINKPKNLMFAEVEGEKFPSIIQKGIV